MSKILFRPYPGQEPFAQFSLSEYGYMTKNHGEFEDWSNECIYHDVWNMMDSEFPDLDWEVFEDESDERIPAHWSVYEISEGERWEYVGVARDYRV